MKSNQLGATLIEFITIGPMIFFLGMTGVQYTLMYNAKTNLTYASYEAARAGAIENASPEQIEMGLFKGFLPYLSASKGSSGSPADVAKLLVQTRLEEAPFTKIEIINPTAEAFNDFNNPTLQKTLGTQQKVIPNKLTDIENSKHSKGKGSSSGMSVSEANVLKLRITYGYEPAIPLVGHVVASVASFLSGPKDAFRTMLFAAGKIPIVVDVSSQMLSPAVQNGLKTVAYNPEGAGGTIDGNHELPDLSTIKLPEGYEGMSREEILEDIMVSGGKRDKSMSNIDWLKLLAAVGIVGYGASQLDSLGSSFTTGSNGNVVTDLSSLRDFGAQGNFCPVPTTSSNLLIPKSDGNQNY
ncbi:TadE/TadG family type IV pilus assembly protein [Psychrobacter sp. K31L]|uniref:TadE/TadG family type IV pilus assembly protein n=1 Tax=Psychrobacter sp. K31L TaxID=2820758 RepID=UPI001B33DC3E|nr:TadE family protein [Psychrobacter sp. K31L]MBP3946753.1 pilus assembly protein [Psychrobacter sp. K31L]